MCFCRGFSNETVEWNSPSPPVTRWVPRTITALAGSSSVEQRDAFSLAEELPAVADSSKCPRPPEMENLAKMVEPAAVSAYYTLDDSLDTSAPERDRLYSFPLDSKRSWARVLRQIMEFDAGVQ